jgi:hypothetical protein
MFWLIASMRVVKYLRVVNQGKSKIAGVQKTSDTKRTVNPNPQPKTVILFINLPNSMYEFIMSENWLTIYCFEDWNLISP